MTYVSIRVLSAVGLAHDVKLPTLKAKIDMVNGMRARSVPG